METILVIGSTGNIGVSAVHAALRSGRNVLAVVRNQGSAEKLLKNVEGAGSPDRITCVIADITSDTGVRVVVDRVRSGTLPPFQHVFSAGKFPCQRHLFAMCPLVILSGGGYPETSLLDLSTDELRNFMTVNFESNFIAYRETMPYLLGLKDAKCTWTLCTGAQGDIGARAAPAISQGALFSMANAACHDNTSTNVRFNEIYLGTRVEVDTLASETGAMKSSEFAQVYERILSKTDFRGGRISVFGYDDLSEPKFTKKH